MAKSTRQVKNLASTFSGGKSMETDLQSKFVRGSEGEIKRRRISGKTPQEGLPSSASIFSELTGLPMGGVTSSSNEAEGIKSSRILHETNIGFKLLKKSGWKEGTGLGISEQGRLNPLEPQLKSDRRGIGAEKDRKQKTRGRTVQQPSNEDDGKTPSKATRKEKNLARRAKKMKVEEERMLEQALEQQFYREFLPENV